MVRKMEKNFFNSIVENDMKEIYKSIDEWHNLRGKKVYITGASGMLASYFVMILIYLNEKYNMEIDIYICVRHIQKAYIKFGEYVEKPYFHVIIQDVVDAVKLSEKVDYIVHAASLASPQFYGKYPVETMAPNIIGTYELLKYSVDNTNLERFLFFSSDSIYGEIKDKLEVDETTYGDFDFLDIGNFYGESKRCGEALCKAFYIEYGIPVNSIRIHHTYAPTMDIDNDKRAFSEFVKNVVDNQDIVLKSSGNAKRAFCYITDAIIGMFMVLFRGKKGESYNIGNPYEYRSIAELASIIAKLSPKKSSKVVRQIRENSINYQSRASVSQSNLCIKKIKEIGWEPKISVEEGFRRCIQYHTERMN